MLVFHLYLQPMKNKIEELATIITLVKDDLKSKEKALIDANAFTSHSQGHINNIQKRIKALELDAKKIEDRYADKPDVFVNFRKRASEIMEEIASLC
jgi:predicted nuclease with TOPRIM domain